MDFRNLFITVLVVVAPLASKADWHPALDNLLLVEYWDTTNPKAAPKLAYKIAYKRTAETFHLNNENPPTFSGKKFLGLELLLEKSPSDELELTEYGQLVLIGKDGKKQILGQRGPHLLNGSQAKILTLQEEGDLIIPPHVVASHVWKFNLNQSFITLNVNKQTSKVEGLMYVGTCQQAMKDL